MLEAIFGQAVIFAGKWALGDLFAALVVGAFVAMGLVITVGNILIYALRRYVKEEYRGYLDGAVGFLCIILAYGCCFWFLVNE